MTATAALNYLEEHRERFQNELIELLRIPSISFDPVYEPDVKRAAGWLAEKLRLIGVHNVDILPTEGHPVVYGEWMGAGADAPLCARATG